MLGLSVYEFSPGMERISGRTFAQRAAALSAEGPAWRLEDGWTRAFATTGAAEKHSARFRPTIGRWTRCPRS